MDSAVRSSIRPPGRTHRRIGEILLSKGLITELDVQRVLAAQVQRKERFGETAVALKLLTAGQLRTALAQQFHYPVAIPGGSPLSGKLLAAFEPAGPYAEALRTLRSELLMRWFGEHGSMLAVVSGRDDEGCSTVAANLAIAFAQLGERTLLVDMNLRAPSQQLLFNSKSRRGVSELLSERTSLTELEADEPFPNLHVLCAGVAAPNPQELLSRARLAHLLTELAANFDAVIVDTPPMLKFADAQIIAARTGGSLLVTRRNHTRVADIERMKSQLRSCGSTLLGAVVSE